MKLSNEARIGIIVFVAGLIFVGGVMYLRGVDFQQKEYSLFILYDNVSGLREGSPISVAGYMVGKVEGIQLAGAHIAVEASIQRKVMLTRTARAEIKSASIMGGKFIAVTPGEDGQILADGDTLRGTYQADLTELTSTLAPIGSNMLGILENVNETFDEKTRTGIKQIVQEIGRASEQVNQVVEIQGDKLDRVLNNFSIVSTNLVRFSEGLDTMARAQRAMLDSSLAAIRTMTGNLQEASENIQKTTQSLDTVFTRVERGEGTLGRVMRDDALYRHVDSVALTLNSVLLDLKESPGRYIRFSIF